MRNCSECGRKLRFWEGYRHPVQGKNYLVCSCCFNFIDKGVEIYRKCLYEGRQNYKNKCYFWDPENNRCKNEKYFIPIKRKTPNFSIIDESHHRIFAQKL